MKHLKYLTCALYLLSLVMMGMATPKTVIVMGDNRELSRKVPSTIDEATDFHQLTAVMALAYAKRHNYEYFRFHYDFSGFNCSESALREHVKHTCFHPRIGQRHASWCSLLLVSRILRQSENMSATNDGHQPYLVNMDSDMCFNNLETRIEDYLRQETSCKPIPRLHKNYDKYKFPCQRDNECFPLETAPFATEGKAFCDQECQNFRRYAPFHAYYDGGTNAVQCGVMFWDRSRSEEGLDILRVWWDKESVRFPWEQGAMTHDVWPRFPNKIRIMGCNPKELRNWVKPEYKSRIDDPYVKHGKFLTHIVHFQDKNRLKWFGQILRVIYGITDQEFSVLYRELLENHSVAVGVREMAVESLRLFKERFDTAGVETGVTKSLGAGGVDNWPDTSELDVMLKKAGVPCSP